MKAFDYSEAESFFNIQVPLVVKTVIAMKRSPISLFLYFFLLASAGWVSAQNLRLFPEGTQLSNGMVTPIYIETLDPAGDASLTKIVLKDATGYRLTLYAERTVRFDNDGEAIKTLRLFLHQSPLKDGSVAIEEKSSEEKTLINAFAVGLENYAPGWTNNWSIEGHRELKDLVQDLRNRQRAQ